jgi:glyoxylase-like metal-dependent hydrolase (beta-lactamase superfamily II)
MEIAPGIHRIQAPLGDRFVCVFALVGDEATLVFDTGLKNVPTETVAPYFKEQGLDFDRVRYVLISHADFDHNGGNGELKKLAPNAIYMCHELDRAQIADTKVMNKRRYNEWSVDHEYPVNPDVDNWILDNVSDIPIDVGLSGGERIRLGADWFIDVLHTAGHSWGHLSLYDPRSKTAVIADAALYNSVLTAEGKPAFPPTYRYLDTYVATIQRLQGMPIDTLLTSHYPTYQGSDVAEFLGESLAYTDRVDRALGAALAAAGKALTMKEVIQAVKPALNNWGDGVAEGFLMYPLTGHLEQMTQYGKVTLGRRDGFITYQWKG